MQALLGLADYTGTGIYMRKSWIWRGRLAFVLKNVLDRHFIKMFQVSGESEEVISRGS